MILKINLKSNESKILLLDENMRMICMGVWRRYAGKIKYLVKQLSEQPYAIRSSHQNINTADRRSSAYIVRTK